MGLFCLSMKKTPEDQLKCALGNLSIFRELIEAYDGILDKHGNRMPDYLIGFAESQIRESLELLKSSVDRA